MTRYDFLEAIGVSTLFLYQWVQSEAAVSVPVPVPVPARPETGVSASL